MHLLFILQISLFQETVLFKCCCTFVMVKAFLFSFPSICSSGEKPLLLSWVYFVLGTRGGTEGILLQELILSLPKAHFVPVQTLSLICRIQRAESVHHRLIRTISIVRKFQAKSYPVHNHTQRFNRKTQPSTQTN